MGEKRTGLVLSVGRLWLMSLPFRLVSRLAGPGYAPALRNFLVYELRRLWHRLYERERLIHRAGRLHAIWRRVRRR